MNDVSQAIKVAVCVRNYLKENSQVVRTNAKELIATQERIANQIRNISGLK